MGPLVVTAEHVKAARKAGACTVPKVGTPILDLTNEQLAWCEAAMPEIAKAVAAEIANGHAAVIRGAPPLSGSGSGYGYGYGSGSGYGDGYGSGSGYGDGYGSGSGYGSGYGDGDGDVTKAGARVLVAAKAGGKR